MMKIELKNLKINLQFSQETIMFKADVYADGKKIAYASNEGYGGPTSYHPYSGYFDMVIVAESYCAGLPKKTYGDFSYPQKLESVIDDLVEEELNKKEKEKFNKKLQKDMLKGLVYAGSDHNQYSLVSWKGTDINQMLTTSWGKSTIMFKIKELTNAGKKILNTNLPENTLSL